MSMTEEQTQALPEDQLDEILSDLRQQQQSLLDGFERLAAAVSPLLTAQYETTQNRIRALEQRIVQRQERPTVVALVRLLETGRRLRSPKESALHLMDGLTNLVEGLGYEFFGTVADSYDESTHDVIDAVAGEQPVVTIVHQRGIRAGEDVVVRARVETGPAQIADPASSVTADSGEGKPTTSVGSPTRTTQQHEETK
jgi:hypothetical protein